MNKPSTSSTTSVESGVRRDGNSPYGPGESYKTGSASKQERLEAFIDWLLTPDSERQPRTKREFAELWGVSTQTLRNDAREPYVQRELAVRARAVARVEDLPRVIENLLRIAAGDPGPGIDATAIAPPSAQVSAAKVLLDWWAKTEPIREADVHVTDLTDEQLVEMALRLLNTAQDAAT